MRNPVHYIVCAILLAIGLIIFGPSAKAQTTAELNRQEYARHAALMAYTPQAARPQWVQQPATVPRAPSAAWSYQPIERSHQRSVGKQRPYRGRAVEIVQTQPSAPAPVPYMAPAPAYAPRQYQPPVVQPPAPVPASVAQPAAPYPAPAVMQYAPPPSVPAFYRPTAASCIRADGTYDPIQCGDIRMVEYQRVGTKCDAQYSGIFNSRNRNACKSVAETPRPAPEIMHIAMTGGTAYPGITVIPCQEVPQAQTQAYCEYNARGERLTPFFRGDGTDDIHDKAYYERLVANSRRVTSDPRVIALAAAQPGATAIPTYAQPSYPPAAVSPDNSAALLNAQFFAKLAPSPPLRI